MQIKRHYFILFIIFFNLILFSFYNSYFNTTNATDKIINNKNNQVIIANINELERVQTNHLDNDVTKLVLANYQHNIPNLMQWSRAEMKANTEVEFHAHFDMYEMFYILNGTIELIYFELHNYNKKSNDRYQSICLEQSNNNNIKKTRIITKDTYFIIPPLHCHSLKNIQQDNIVDMMVYAII